MTYKQTVRVFVGILLALTFAAMIIAALALLGMPLF